MHQSRLDIVESESVQSDWRLASSSAAKCGAVCPEAGNMIINADDWGSDSATNSCTLKCVLNRVVSSVSAMVFMKGSEEGALLALQHGVAVGLHLNFTAPFSMSGCSSKLVEHQERCARFLESHRLAPVVYHPGLAASFRYVTEAQFDEFERIFGCRPDRVDGHHHMHLCANVLMGKLLPEGMIVRKNFSFRRGEKGPINRRYRHWQDRVLARHHRTTDLFFSLLPLNSRGRFEGISNLARRYDVEVETHPSNHEEFQFLMGGDLIRCIGEVKVSSGYRLRVGPGIRSAEGYS